MSNHSPSLSLSLVSLESSVLPLSRILQTRLRLVVVYSTAPQCYEPQQKLQWSI